MSNIKKKGISIPLFITLLIISQLLILVCAGFLYLKQQYKGSAVAYSNNLIKNLNENDFNMNFVKLFYSKEEIKNIKKGIEFKVETKENNPNTNGIEIFDLKGSTYEGKMMIVHNPEDLIVAVNPSLDSGGSGKSLEEYIEMYNGIAGINAGGFEDDGGKGNGGQAWGIVISDGKLVSGRLDEFTSVIGINSKHRLIVGNMTAKQALDWDIKEAVTFGPIFIDQFKVVFEKGRHPGLNPRTVIGQREDGAFLLLVIDGRQPSSFGSTYQDIIDIMLDFNAMTAANLDGGNSTVMIYDNQQLNTTVSIYGARNLPTAFVVKKGN